MVTQGEMVGITLAQKTERSNAMKAKLNTEQIVNGDVNYPASFVELAKELDGKVIEVSEVPFGGYDFEYGNSTYALYDTEIIPL